MRKNEGDEVEAAFAGRELHFIRVNAQERFLKLLQGVSDPEKKRKIIGSEFVRVFEDEALKLGDIRFLAQGTIYPDVVESGVDSAVIKSHHNVGGLPEDMTFKELVEPLRGLFKDEVRALGRQLGLPKALVERQPFPGPRSGCSRHRRDYKGEAGPFARSRCHLPPGDEALPGQGRPVFRRPHRHALRGRHG